VLQSNNNPNSVGIMLTCELISSCTLQSQVKKKPKTSLIFSLLLLFGTGAISISRNCIISEQIYLPCNPLSKQEIISTGILQVSTFYRHYTQTTNLPPKKTTATIFVFLIKKTGNPFFCYLKIFQNWLPFSGKQLHQLLAT